MSKASSPGNPAKKKRKLRQAWAIVIAALITGGAGVLVGLLAAPQPTKVTSPPTKSPEPVSLAVPLGFSLNSGATVPWCGTYDGLGSIPKGDSLVLFDSPAQSNGQPVAQTLYYFDGLFQGPSGSKWSIGPVYIGNRADTGFKAALDAILVSNKTAAFINSIGVHPMRAAQKASVAWKVGQLPPGLIHIHLNVTRGSDENQCG